MMAGVFSLIPVYPNNYDSNKTFDSIYEYLININAEFSVHTMAYPNPQWLIPRPSHYASPMPYFVTQGFWLYGRGKDEIEEMIIFMKLKNNYIDFQVKQL